MTGLNELLNAFQSVFTIVLLIVVGYLLQTKGRITDAIGGFLSFFVVNITLPFSVFRTVSSNISAENIKALPLLVGVIIVSQLISMLLAWLLSRVIRISEDRKGSFIVLTAFNNTLFMGIPVSEALFGEGNSSVILCYYLASTILFWSLAVRIIAGKSYNGKFKMPKPLIGMIVGFCFVLFRTYVVDFELPKFIDDTTRYLASMTTPLSMIFTGFALGQFGLKNIRFDKSVVFGIFARFILSPAIFVLAIWWLPIDELQRDVFTVQAFMPVMASQTIIARQYGADAKYPALMVSVTTILSLIIIPIVKSIIT